MRTGVQIPPAPPISKIPTLIGWDFFCPIPQCWRGFRPWPLEHGPPERALPGSHSATFLSLFSAALLSIQGPKSFIYEDLRAIGLLFRLLGMARPRQRKAQKTLTGDRAKNRNRGIGRDAMHLAIDDHSRVSFASIKDDEKAVSCVQFLRDAVAYYAS